MKKTLLTIISVGISLYLLTQATSRKVLLTGIDGCRFDAIEAAKGIAIRGIFIANTEGKMVKTTRIIKE